MAIRTFRKGQEIKYQYKKTGLFPMRFTSSISALGIQGEADFTQLQAIENLDEKFYKILENGFKNCIQLTSVTFNQSLSALDSSAFENCRSLKSIAFSPSMRSIGDSSFKNCQMLQSASFTWFDEEAPSSLAAASTQLTSIGSDVFTNCNRLSALVCPSSITSTVQIDANAFRGASFSQVTLLGIPSSSSQDIARSKVFGLAKDCTIYTSDQSKFRYYQTIGTCVQDTTYQPYGSIGVPTIGKTKLRKLFKFDKDAVQWCIDPTSRTGASASKFPSVTCPIIVVYLDLKTSPLSKKFLDDVLEDSQFQKSLKTVLNCYLFVLSRDNQIEWNDSADQNLVYFRNTLSQGKKVEQEFVSLNFYYGQNFSSATTASTTPAEVIQLLQAGAQSAGFDSFDYEPFDIKLEDPYVEVVPSGSGTAQDGCTPWWWTGNGIQSIPDWSV